MPPRQTNPERWLLVTAGDPSRAEALAKRLPRGSGIVLLTRLSGHEMRRLRYIALARGLTVVVEWRGVAWRRASMTCENCARRWQRGRS
jgi:hypothetical protein